MTGSTRKIYRQKGTGRARHGAVRAPIFVHGGIAFGPTPRDFSLNISKKMKQTLLLTITSLILLSACTTQNDIEFSSKDNTTEGLNLFTVDKDGGIIKGAYLEGEYRVDFEARRGGLRPWIYLLFEPQYGFYDRSGCFISKSGDPFIIFDSCSVPPLCPPEADSESEACQIDDEVRTKEFQLAEKVAKEIQNITFPRSLKWQKEILTTSILAVTNEMEISSSPVSSTPSS